MGEVLGVKLADQHYWIDKYLNDQPIGMFIVHGYEELIEVMNTLVEETGTELDVPVIKDLYSREGMVVSVKNNEYDNEIRFEISPCYTEEECIAAGLLDSPGKISLDNEVWGGLFSVDEYHKLSL